MQEDDSLFSSIHSLDSLYERFSSSASPLVPKMLFSSTNMICVILCFLCTFALGLDLVSTGSTVALNGVPYYIPSTPYFKIPNFNSRVLAGKGSGYGGIVPATVVKATAAVTLAQLSRTIAAYGSDDDVWQPGFLSGRHDRLGDAKLCSSAKSSQFLVGEADFASHLHPVQFVHV